jgi:hypothetical protein
MAHCGKRVVSEPTRSVDDSISHGGGLVRLGLPCSGGLPPRTLQALAAEREALCAELVRTGATFALTPKALWRYVWFEHREVHLIASLLADAEASRICQAYLDALRSHAGRMYAHPNPLSVRIGLFGAVLDSSYGFWRALRRLLCSPGAVPIVWPVRDAETWLWLQFCKLHVLVGTTPDGRSRSRRELGAIIAELDYRANANTVRLRLLPRVEQECAAGDGWAAGLCRE